MKEINIRALIRNSESAEEFIRKLIEYGIHVSPEEAAEAWEKSRLLCSQLSTKEMATVSGGFFDEYADLLSGDFGAADDAPGLFFRGGAPGFFSDMFFDPCLSA